MRTINEHEKHVVQTACQGLTIHYSAIVRFYKAEEQQWQQVITGAAVIASDSVSHYLKVVDLSVMKKKK